MVGLAVREFQCALCQKQFTLLSGDLMFPGPNICDECLGEVWGLEGEELAKHVAECLAGEERIPVNSIVQHIRWHKEQWRSADEVVRDRERERRAQG